MMIVTEHLALRPDTVWQPLTINYPLFAMNTQKLSGEQKNNGLFCHKV